MPLSLENIGMTSSELEFEINRGGRFVIFQYCISVLVITFKRPTSVKFIKAGGSAAAKSLPYTILSLLLGMVGNSMGIYLHPTGHLQEPERRDGCHASNPRPGSRLSPPPPNFRADLYTTSANHLACQATTMASSPF